MISAMVRKKLLNSPGVTALVSTRIYPDEIPTPEPPGPVLLPAITIHKPSDIPDEDVSKGAFARVQVSCWAETGKPKNPAVVEAVAAAVKAVMNVPRLNNKPERWTIGSVSYDFMEQHCRNAPRLIDPVTGWYHVPIDCEIDYQEV